MYISRAVFLAHGALKSTTLIEKSYKKNKAKLMIRYDHTCVAFFQIFMQKMMNTNLLFDRHDICMLCAL